jgi:signal transduction histidine kinase
LTRDEALKMLNSSSAHERLKGARFLARNSDASDASTLREARKVETVSYVRDSLDRALSRSIERTPGVVPHEIDDLEVPEEARKRIRSKAIEWITGFVLHEVASLTGLIARAASQEIPNYDSSRTQRHVQTLQRIFPAIEQLKGATAAPRREEFDLAELLLEIQIAESAESGVVISPQGPRPLLITSDPALLRLAVRNGIRNAIEAIVASPTNDPHPVVLTWGETDTDYWVVIIDRGPGLVGPTELVFELGKSHKVGHIGFGLAIARQAIETLGGTVILEPAAGGGTRYELRWDL